MKVEIFLNFTDAAKQLSP